MVPVNVRQLSRVRTRIASRRSTLATLRSADRLPTEQTAVLVSTYKAGTRQQASEGLSLNAYGVVQKIDECALSWTHRDHELISKSVRYFSELINFC